jgi:hypothetical protein
MYHRARLKIDVIPYQLGCCIAMDAKAIAYLAVASFPMTKRIKRISLASGIGDAVLI